MEAGPREGAGRTGALKGMGLPQFDVGSVLEGFL